MIKTKALIVILFISFMSFGQTSELSVFDNLVAKTWKAEGTWGDGSKFIQEISIDYALDSTLVILNSIGFTDQEQTQLGLRNHGIRQYDKESKSIRFWEFDVFGGLTEGIVIPEVKNIIYQYEYGGSHVTDMWEYVNDSTYNFKVGNYEDGIWKQVYLSTQFVEVKEK